MDSVHPVAFYDFETMEFITSTKEQQKLLRLGVLICKQCQRRNPAESKYCNECATEIGQNIFESGSFGEIRSQRFMDLFGSRASETCELEISKVYSLIRYSIPNWLDQVLEIVTTKCAADPEFFLFSEYRVPIGESTQFFLLKILSLIRQYEHGFEPFFLESIIRFQFIFAPVVSCLALNMKLLIPPEFVASALLKEQLGSLSKIATSKDSPKVVWKRVSLSNAVFSYTESQSRLFEQQFGSKCLYFHCEEEGEMVDFRSMKVQEMKSKKEDRALEEFSLVRELLPGYWISQSHENWMKEFLQSFRETFG